MREYRAVVATTDFHSAFTPGLELLAQLARERAAGALVADSGDFFEGTGYYTLGGGGMERAALTRLYTVVAPGNHGLAHHRMVPELTARTVCCNLLGPDAAAPFPTHRWVRLTGRGRILITGILGAQALAATPPHERAGLAHLDPTAALATLWAAHGQRATGLVVLSHAGFTHDLTVAAELAHAGPPAPVLLLAGHCHSQLTSPTQVGDQIVVAQAPACGQATSAPPSPAAAPGPSPSTSRPSTPRPRRAIPNSPAWQRRSPTPRPDWAAPWARSPQPGAPA